KARHTLPRGRCRGSGRPPFTNRSFPGFDHGRQSPDASCPARLAPPGWQSGATAARQQSGSRLEGSRRDGSGTDGASQARRHADSMSGPWPDREHDTRCGLPHGDGCTYTLRKDIPMTTLTSDHQTILSLSQTPSPAMPLTGAEYLDSLRDDREIWIYGERVKDVTTHPAFRNSARSVARLYDALHDPAHRAVL